MRTEGHLLVWLRYTNKGNLAKSLASTYQDYDAFQIKSDQNVKQ